MEGRSRSDASGPRRQALSTPAPAAPLFSIGVTTYDRLELLRETLQSVLRQDCTDVEILVGNDNPARTLDAGAIGTDDPRVRIINHPVNLGEMGNMNALLAEARGRYFSWLADDDLYADGLLAAVSRAIEAFHGPACVLTAYSTEKPGDPVGAAGPIQLDAADFLHRYLSRSLPVLGCYGFYARDQLLALGGMTRLSPGLSPYSDNLLALKAALLRPVVIEQPLIFFRTHQQSLSFTSIDAAAYRVAQQALWSVFNDQLLPRVSVDDEARDAVRADLLAWCVKDFFGVVGRSGRWQEKELKSYALFLRSAYLDFDRYPWGVATIVSRERLKLPLRILLQKWRGRAGAVQ